MKSILISDKLHKELKLYAIMHSTSILKIAENAIGNLISAKASTSQTLNQEDSTQASSPILKEPVEVGAPRTQLDPSSYL